MREKRFKTKDDLWEELLKAREGEFELLKEIERLRRYNESLRKNYEARIDELIRERNTEVSRLRKELEDLKRGKNGGTTTG